MNNDLISRKALREELKQYFTEGTLDGISAKLAFNQILHDIDNAPTVEPYCYFCGQKEHGIRIATNLQLTCNNLQQGEWITRHKEDSFGEDIVCFECNKCGKYTLPIIHTLIIEPLGVCPNCGAKMRIGGAE